MTIPDWVRIGGAVILPSVGGFLGSKLMTPETRAWYKNLRKPYLTPPGAVFPPMWTLLYSGMGYASYLVWRDGGGFKGSSGSALAIYGASLALNWAWTPIFFGSHKLGAALMEILGLLGSVILTGVMFRPINQTAGRLFIPYTCWVAFATYLNFEMWRLNPTNELEDEKTR